MCARVETEAERARRLFAEYLRRNGHHVTKKRLFMAEEIFRLKPRHFDAEAILELLRRQGRWREEFDRFPLSRATVYRTLDLMVRAGLLSKSTMDEGPARYEVKLGRQHHHHMICEGCGEIVEFVDWGHEHLVRQAAACRGWQFVDSELIIHGLCPRCKARQQG